MQQRMGAIVAGLVVVGGLGIVGGAQGLAALCGFDADLPAPKPVLALAGQEFTLVQELPPGDAAAQPAPENHPCGGKIRPGARVIINNAFLCTLNWIYADSAGALYVGTAGHCARTPGVYATAGVADIGDTVYSVNAGIGNDFALIKINPLYYDLVDPTLCHWGGPQGTATGNPAGDQLVVHYGWGVDFNTFSHTRPRAGAVISMSPSAVTFYGAVSPGDSGSPLMVYDPETQTGLAAGVITHTFSYLPPHLWPQYGTRVDSGIARASAAIPGADFRVVHSLLEPDLTGLTIPE